MDVGPNIFDLMNLIFSLKKQHGVKSLSEKPRELLLY